MQFEYITSLEGEHVKWYVINVIRIYYINVKNNAC